MRVQTIEGYGTPDLDACSRAGGESDNESYILQSDHLPLPILDIDGAFEGELVFNSKEVLLECRERLHPEGQASTYRHQMGAAEERGRVRMDANGHEDLFPGCRGACDKEGDLCEITRAGKSKVGNRVIERLCMCHAGAFGHMPLFFLY
jgi:hypothetical protein